MKMSATEVHALLLNEGRVMQLPQIHHNDLLVHDLKILSGEFDGTPFAWCLYECGTHLVLPDSIFMAGYRNNKPASEFVRCIVSVFGEPQYWYWYNGKGVLRSVTPEGAMRLLDEERARLVREAKREEAQHAAL